MTLSTAAPGWAAPLTILGRRAAFTHGESLTLRHLLVPMIEEHARRNGHADLSERIDGTVGE